MGKGSFTSMPHLDTMGWTADERLLHVKRGSSETWYTYDSTGQRVRKVTEKGGLTEERLYLGGFEIYRKRQGTTVTLERETLHLMDGNRRIALVETKTVGTTTTPLPATVTRYQLDNHLQSASLELDETASVISYEEYYPYGDTSYRSARSGVEVSEKRYRYTGKEKDEETGLYYHGARYYAAWLGRWTAADPSGMVDGACVYAYVRNHPTGLVDPDGRAGERPEPGKIRLSHGDYDRNTWNPSSISRPQIDHDPSGLRHSLQFPKGEPPTPYPKEKLGSLDYYKFRHDDFVRRNPKSNAPEYYLNYGDKYAKRFTEETKSTLSKAGVPSGVRQVILPYFHPPPIVEISSPTLTNNAFS